MWIVWQNNHIKNMKNPLTVLHCFQTQKKLPAPSEAQQPLSQRAFQFYLTDSNPIRIDGARSILLYSVNAAAFGNCRSAAWPWEPAGACRGSIGFCGHCQRQFISPKSDQNGWSYIHITLFRKSGRIWKLQVRGMAVGPRGCLPRLNRVLRALSGPI